MLFSDIVALLDIHGVTHALHTTQTWSHFNTLAEMIAPLPAVPAVNPGVSVSLLLAGVVAHRVVRGRRSRAPISRVEH
ncbi:MAG: hypothetical protein M3Y80_01475 [Verrucomicrobiota bacterium]|nr:hypothetical protein [Verrucomicrobiota bacterium]